MIIKDKINEVLQEKESKYSVALFNDFSVSGLFNDDLILNTIERNFSDESIEENGLLAFQKGEAVLEIISVSNLLKINIFDFESYARSEDKLLHLKKI